MTRRLMPPKDQMLYGEGGYIPGGSALFKKCALSSVEVQKTMLQSCESSRRWGDVQLGNQLIFGRKGNLLCQNRSGLKRGCLDVAGRLTSMCILYRALTKFLSTYLSIMMCIKVRHRMKLFCFLSTSGTLVRIYGTILEYFRTISLLSRFVTSWFVTSCFVSFCLYDCLSRTFSILF